MIETWARRCPQGHTSVTTYADTYYCRACGETYRGEPYDAAETDFPVADDEPRVKDAHDDALEALVRACESPTITWRRARDLPGFESPRRVGKLLATLADDGLVERGGRQTSSRAELWRPTEAGRQQVVETERKVVLDRGRKQRARERAQLSPVAHGVMTLVIGLAGVATAALAHGVIG